MQIIFPGDFCHFVRDRLSYEIENEDRKKESCMEKKETRTMCNYGDVGEPVTTTL